MQTVLKSQYLDVLKLLKDYMGDITAVDDSYEQIRSADGINLVKMRFQLKHAVSNSIMKYLHS